MLTVLLIKTSSMGDVIHNLPVVSDIVEHFPDAVVDWVVEQPFSEIPRLHPAVRAVIPVAVRRWRKHLLQQATWREIAACKAAIRNERYDAVIDTQGLVKSALIARAAVGARHGFAADSAREPIAARCYDQRYSVARNLHAVERNRLLAGQVLGYTPGTEVRYGIGAPHLVLPWLGAKRYAVLLHATSRADKLWPEADWIALGKQLNSMGFACVLPWGTADEQVRSQRLANAMANAVAAPRLTLLEAAGLLAAAGVVIGVDTGLTHLAAALGVPVVALYCSTSPGLTGVYGNLHAINLGQAGQPPSLATVWAHTMPFATAPAA